MNYLIKHFEKREHKCTWNITDSFYEIVKDRENFESYDTVFSNLLGFEIKNSYKRDDKKGAEYIMYTDANNRIVYQLLYNVSTSLVLNYKKL